MIEWQIVLGAPQQVVTVHREVVKGSVSVQNPNLPIKADVANNATSEAYDLFVAGRQFAVLGRRSGSRRVTAEARTGVTVSDSFIPLISFRRKTEFPPGVTNRVSAQLGRLTLLTDTELIWEIRQGMDLTDASFGSVSRVSDSETGLEVDTSATAASGGEYVEGDIEETGQRNTRNLARRDLRFEPPRQEPVTVIAKKVPGVTDANVNVQLSMRELW